MPDNIYDEIYKKENYYWGLEPSRTCLRVLQACPPIRKLKLLDIGCGEGRNAAFFARNGYDVTAFDFAQAGVEKTRALASTLGLKINVFQADINVYRLTDTFDILFSTGVLHYVAPENRTELFTNYREMTSLGGAHMFSVFVDKPFLAPPPEHEINAHKWTSGELLGHYASWKIEYSAEEIADCNSSGIPHQHATNRVLARKI